MPPKPSLTEVKADGLPPWNTKVAGGAPLRQHQLCTNAEVCQTLARQKHPVLLKIRDLTPSAPSKMQSPSYRAKQVTALSKNVPDSGADRNLSYW